MEGYETPEAPGPMMGEVAPDPAPREDVLRSEEDLAEEMYSGEPVADHWEVKTDG